MLNFAVYPCRGGWQAAVRMGTRIVAARGGFTTGQEAYAWLFEEYGHLLALKVEDIKDLARNRLLRRVVRNEPRRRRTESA